MADQMCNVRIDGEEKSYPCGTPFLEIVKDYQKNYKDDIVLVMFNRKLRELHKRLKKDGEISFVTTADNVGKKVYRRSVILLMQKAVYNLYGRKECPRAGTAFDQTGVFLQADRRTGVK